MENNAETKFTGYNTVKNLFEKELDTKAWEIHKINDSLTLDDVNFDEEVTILQKNYNFNYNKEML
ncbi:MAG: hypothetical protein RR273_01585 [Oscillospiraceae bacterium]